MSSWVVLQEPEMEQHKMSLSNDLSLYYAAVEQFRGSEYPMLKDSIYLDHAGTTQYPRSLMERFASEMTHNLFGNPHSASGASQLSTARIEDARLRALQFLGADPAEFDLVFVANATAGIKLVAEAGRSLPGGFRYAYHHAAHTSLVGVGEEARYSVCLDDRTLNAALAGEDPFLMSEPELCSRPPATTLFAYTAQSNMDGRRFPLSWAGSLRNSGQQRQPAGSGGRAEAYTLLDAASLVSTSSLDLSDSESAPDFIVLSFYKIFGFPDLGALIVRRQAEPFFDSRRYFGGGTVEMAVSVKEQWHVLKSHFLHERLEDGTLPVHSILALDAAMSIHQRLFGSMSTVASHTAFLAQRLRAGLSSLKHGNATPVCVIYSGSSTGPQQQAALSVDTSPAGWGPIVAFNIRNASGHWVSLAEFEKLAALKNIHVRTGGVCNPGGIATALGLEPWEMKRNFSAGFRCGTDNDIMAGKPTGVIRASVGAMSTISDVDMFIAFVAEFFRDDAIPLADSAEPAPTIAAPSSADGGCGPELFVDSLIVFPIKSCGGYAIPTGVDWDVKPEGLAWDREWCLLHRGSGQALSQKRHPKMALLKPILDFSRGELRVRYSGLGGRTDEEERLRPREIAVPLSQNPALFHPAPGFRATSSRVCGEAVAAKTYASEEVNSFFSDALGVPCILARFPPGGSGIGKRYSKARIQKHQLPKRLLHKIPTHIAPPPSPPDSDLENLATDQRQHQRILLSNESPILAINLASVHALNEEIKSRGGTEVSAASFRANVMIGCRGGGGGGRTMTGSGCSTTSDNAYAEDDWRGLKIGSHASFVMLGSCRRCHMVCIDQDTGRKGEEPFVTLSKTRRFDGKVFFGTHMGLAGTRGSSSLTSGGTTGAASACPTIRVGDCVQVDQDEDS